MVTPIGAHPGVVPVDLLPGTAETAERARIPPGVGLSEPTPSPPVAREVAVLAEGTRTSLGRAAEQAERRLAEGRAAGEAFRRLHEKLAAMLPRFEGIVKYYPPYPPDNPRRIELLNQISGLRQEIEKIQIPPPYDVLLAQQIAALAPQGEPPASDAEIARQYGAARALVATLTDAGRSGPAPEAELSVRVRADLAATPHSLGLPGEVVRALL